ncbi:MAG: amidohydrolase family protein, partial [Desulfurellaceae bacterium]|nr:amidohydrolase family protein [Desulfurellaceae bacterium]
QLEYTYELFNADEDRIPELITHDQVMVGLSDGGAHVDMLCDAGYCTYLLGTWVRERQAMSLEHAVKRITSEPAAFYGLTSRGRIAQGLAADFAIFDLNTVGSKKRGEMRSDLPGGGRRLVMPDGRERQRPVRGSETYRRTARSGAAFGPVLSRYGPPARAGAARLLQGRSADRPSLLVKEECDVTETVSRQCVCDRYGALNQLL